MKKCIILVAVLIALAVSCVAVLADDSTCLSGQSTIAIAGEVQKCRKLTETIAEYEKALALAEQRIAALEQIESKDEQIIKLKDEQIKIQEQALKNMKDMLDLLTDSVKKLKEASQPSFFDQLKNTSLGIVMGAIVTGIMGIAK